MQAENTELMTGLAPQTLNNYNLAHLGIYYYLYSVTFTSNFCSFTLLSRGEKKLETCTTALHHNQPLSDLWLFNSSLILSFFNHTRSETDSSPSEDKAEDKYPNLLSSIIRLSCLIDNSPCKSKPFLYLDRCNSKWGTVWNQNIETVKYNLSSGTPCKIGPLFYRQESWFIALADQGLEDDSDLPRGTQRLRKQTNTTRTDKGWVSEGHLQPAETGFTTENWRGDERNSPLGSLPYQHTIWNKSLGFLYAKINSSFLNPPLLWYLLAVPPALTFLFHILFPPSQLLFLLSLVFLSSLLHSFLTMHFLQPEKSFLFIFSAPKHNLYA